MLIPLKAKHDALKAPALVPTNISKISVIFFPLSTSSFFKNTIPAMTLTPPPSKDIIFFGLSFFFIKEI